MENQQKRKETHEGNSRKWTGFIFLIVGVALLMKSMGIPLPDWLLSWECLLILVGLLIGVHRRFRHWGGWMLMVLVGTVFLIVDYFPSVPLEHYKWPIIFICLGFLFILKPRSRRFHRRCFQPHDFWRERKEEWEKRKRQWEQQYKEAHSSEEDFLEVTTVLSTTKKNVLSKDFKGGEIVSFLGGTKINFSQADINGRVVLEATQVLGGTKLIVPPHWDVRAELTSIFGGVEDRRPSDTAIDHEKILVLKGTSVFGGIEIRSF